MDNKKLLKGFVAYINKHHLLRHPHLQVTEQTINDFLIENKKNEPQQPTQKTPKSDRDIPRLCKKWNTCDDSWMACTEGCGYGCFK